MSVHHNNENVAELDERPAIPSRSRLYCLEPVNLGAGMVESLTSYIARLAAAHSLTLSTFVSKILAPMSTVKGVIGIGGKHDVLYNLGPSLNGTGDTSSDCVRILEMLTGRASLSDLTMQFSAGWLSQRALLCRQQKWCDQCLMEWQSRGATVYYPLVWQLEVVQSCPDHRCLLKSLCPHCSKSHRPLGKHMMLGFCPHCFGWLGTNHGVVCEQEKDNSIHHARQFVAEQSRGLVASTATFTGRQHTAWSSNIQCLMLQHASGIASRFAQNLGINHDTVGCWIQKEHAPTLPSALRVAYAFDLNLVDLLSAPLTREVRSVRSMSDSEMISLFSRTLRRHDAKKILELLTDAAERPADPPHSLMRVCREAGCDQSFVARKFPELAQRIIAHRRGYVQSHKQQRQYFTGVTTKSVASQLAAAGQYPSCRKMNRNLPSWISLRDPLARQAWVEVLQVWGMEL